MNGVILKKIGGYAHESYNKHKYSEVFAECLCCESSNDLINDIIDLLGIER